MRSGKDIEQAMSAHADSVWRVCALRLPIYADAQDAFQEVFLKYALADGKGFSSPEHQKAWLIRVAINVCNDMHRQKGRTPEAPLDEETAREVVSFDESLQPDSDVREDVREVLAAMRALDDPPRTPVYLSVVEGFSAGEIAKALDMPVNTVYSWISRGKKKLREALR